MRNESRDSNRPAPVGFASWNAYWTSQGMPWRTESEIDEERRAYLMLRRAVKPNIMQGVYPFRDEHGSIKLSRADAEWLLANHENSGMRGPVDWSNENQRERTGVDLRGADLRGLNLDGLPLANVLGGLRYNEWSNAEVREEHLSMAAVQLEGATLLRTHLEGAILRKANLRRVNAHEAHLDTAVLHNADLQEAVLSKASLRRADAREAHFEGAVLRRTWLMGTDLREAYFDAATNLRGAVLSVPRDGCAKVADIRWGNVNLAVIDWSAVSTLGDEQEAQRRKLFAGPPSDQRMKDVIRKPAHMRIGDYKTAVRANREVALELQSHGLNEDAARFAYRAQVLQRWVLLRQGEVSRWLFSCLLDLLAGYGYQLHRIFLTYVVTLTAFAFAYSIIGLPNEQATTLLQHITDAYQVSLTAIHGRTFFEQFGIGSALAWVAAAESVCGLVIEAVFTSMLVQRFFAR